MLSVSQVFEAIHEAVHTFHVPMESYVADVLVLVFQPHSRDPCLPQCAGQSEKQAD